MTGLELVWVTVIDILHETKKFKNAVFLTRS